MSKTHNITANRICNHLSAVGLGQHAKPIIHEVQRWIKCNGEEWTVERLKTLKVAYIQSLAGYDKIDLPWIKHTNNRPKGPFAPLFRVHGEKRVMKTLSALMVYTAFTKPISQSDIDKVRTSIEEPGIETEDRLLAMSRLIMKYPALNKRWTSLSELFCREYGKKEESFKFSGLTSGKPLLSRHAGQSDLPWIHSFVEWTGLHAPWNPILKKMGVPIDREIERSYRDVSMGKIHLLSEAGLKVRAVAVPNAAVQVAFEPLHEALSKVLKEIPQDCTFDQRSGALWAQSQLKEGRTVHAVDLSSATDRFPLHFQVGVLEKLESENFKIDIASKFRSVCKNGMWRLPDGDIIRYGAGQPMGLKGSFPMFAVSHHALLGVLWAFLGKESGQDLGEAPYRILGDDIVISDDDLHDQYRRALKKLGAPISEHKSLSSSKVTEFAGFIITKQFITKGVKVPSVSTVLENSFMDYLKLTGKGGLKLLPSKTRKAARWLASVPEEFGGLGWNPQGQPLSERIMLAEWLHNRPKSIPKFLSLKPSLVKAGMTFPSSRLRVIEWLTDQVSNHEREIDQRIPPRLRNMPTEHRSLLCQLSFENEGDVGLAWASVLNKQESRSTLLQQTQAKMRSYASPHADSDVCGPTM